jgi:hypothetical protein
MDAEKFQLLFAEILRTDSTRRVNLVDYHFLDERDADENEETPGERAPPGCDGARDG